MTCQLQSSDSWAIAVQDTGVGIDSSDRQRIFDPYFRVLPESQSYLPNSTGLGLAIVTRLVSLMQGQIEVVSQVGIGSTFTVVLPLNLDLSEAQSIPQEQPAES
jgi:signal transduction histidine kinase